MKKKIVVLTGAGISAESGIPTFRDAVTGLWENYKIEDVCTAKAFNEHPEIVHNFCNELRNKFKDCKPNKAHYALAELEKDYDVQIITQNVDNLHEKAGSTKVLHLHGELMKCRDLYDRIYDIPMNENEEYNTYPGMEINGNEIRPHIVLFGENVPNIQLAVSYMMEADICIVIGTSLNVYPAASLIAFVNAPIYYIDPKPNVYSMYDHVQVIKATATEGMKILTEKLKNDTQE